MVEIERTVLVPVPKVWGLDLSITNEVVLLWVAALLTFVVIVPGCRKRKAIPVGVWQNAVEAIVEFLDKEVIQSTVGAASKAWSPLLLALFFFVLFANLLGEVPVPSVFKAITSNINVTAALALMVFALTIVAGVRAHGILGFLKRFVPGGVPWAILPLLVPIEILSWLARPFSLAVRLFANMFAGHAVLFTFIGMTATAFWLVKPLPLAGAIIMGFFELFVAFIQAFVFTMLAGIYINDALESHH